MSKCSANYDSCDNNPTINLCPKHMVSGLLEVDQNYKTIKELEMKLQKSLEKEVQYQKGIECLRNHHPSCMCAANNLKYTVYLKDFKCQCGQCASYRNRPKYKPRDEG